MNQSGTAPASADFLQRMADSSRRRLAVALADCDEHEMRARAVLQSPAATLRLSDSGFDLIAEVKQRSPSAGRLVKTECQPAEQAFKYSTAGAAAISVLTEPDQFAGELGHLEEIVGRVADVPVMRKDFLVSPYQVYEARASGAGGILLIAAILKAGELRDMLQIALDLGMFILVEAFDRADLERCLPVILELAADPDMARGTQKASDDSNAQILIGVNCRNLRNLQVEFSRFEQLARHLPANIPWVAESGVATPEQAAEVAGLGYGLALVGTALMRAIDPAAAARAILAAGRSATSNS